MSISIHGFNHLQQPNHPTIPSTIWMFPKIGGNTPQNGWFLINGKSYEQMDDLGGFTPIFGNTYIDTYIDIL